MEKRFNSKISRYISTMIFAVLVPVLVLGATAGLSSCEGIWDSDTTSVGQSVPETDFSHLTYAALGDSITKGGIGGALADKPYCVSVGEILGLKSVYNYGVSGSTLCSKSSAYSHGYKPMCERYAEMGEADIVSVMGGTNDFTQGIIGTMDDTRTDTIYGALKALAIGLKEKYPNAFVFFMTPLKSVWSTAERQAQICRAFKEVGAEYGIPVLDTAEIADFSKLFNAEGYSGDGVHPSQEFYTYTLAPVIADFIKTNFAPA